MILVPDHRKLLLLVLGVAVFYNECLSYFSSYMQWPSIPQTGVKILFIADPQILGLTNGSVGILDSIARWDSDRYLSKTFSYALTYQPEVIVFLGDLIDEGSAAPDADTFAEYVRRFDGIYPRDSAKLMLYVPGDNDIGGEEDGLEDDPVTDEKLQRFAMFFSMSSQVTVADGLDLVHVSQLIPTNLTSFEGKPHDGIRIVMSHTPIMFPLEDFSVQVLNHLKPSVMLSAHRHRGLVLYGDRHTGETPEDPIFFSKSSDGPVTVHALTSSTGLLTEIVVPTCSYRMGVQDMAFGLAIVDTASSTLIYHNLWLPSRFQALYLYAAAIIIVGIMFLAVNLKRWYQHSCYVFR